MKRTAELEQRLGHFFAENLPMLVTFECKKRGNDPYRDSKGRFTNPPKYIAKVERVLYHEGEPIITVDVIAQAGGIRRAIGAPDLSGHRIIGRDNLLDVYRACSHQSFRRSS